MSISPINISSDNLSDLYDNSLPSFLQKSVDIRTARSAGFVLQKETNPLLIEEPTKSLLTPFLPAFPKDSFEGMPLNPENVILYLEHLDTLPPPENKYELGRWNWKEFLNFRKLPFYMYLNNIDAVTSCLEVENSKNFFDEEVDEDNDYLEGELGHALLAYAAKNDLSKLLELAKWGDRTSLLLLKAKGIALPEANTVSFDQDKGADYFYLGNEIEKCLACHNYKKAIELLDLHLNKKNLSKLDRDWPTQTRGFCKAMTGDYEGALKDFDKPLEEYNCNRFDLPLIIGLIHYLNNDKEKARVWLCPIKEQNCTIGNFNINFLSSNEDLYSEFALTRILGL